jgi:[NiFe] hydrogenase diaphorase moiety large subunit
MLITEREQLKEDIGRWVAKFGSDRSALIPVLQAIQEKHHHISDYAMQEVADAVGIHPVEVYSVVTFYAFLGETYRGKFVIRLCRTISCDMAGKDALARQLENDLGIKFGESTPDGMFSLQWASCLGMCDQGPAMLVNDKIFTKVTPDTAHEIIAACRRAFGPLSAQPHVKEEHA